jgi:hypothetical protein
MGDDDFERGREIGRLVQQVEDLERTVRVELRRVEQSAAQLADRVVILERAQAQDDAARAQAVDASAKSAQGARWAFAGTVVAALIGGLAAVSVAMADGQHGTGSPSPAPCPAPAVVSSTGR